MITRSGSADVRIPTSRFSPHAADTGFPVSQTNQVLAALTLGAISGLGAYRLAYHRLAYLDLCTNHALTRVSQVTLERLASVSQVTHFRIRRSAVTA